MGFMVKGGEGTDLQASEDEVDGARHHIETVDGFVDVISKGSISDVDAT
jgi:hypothetical protein